MKRFHWHHIEHICISLVGLCNLRILVFSRQIFLLLLIVSSDQFIQLVQQSDPLNPKPGSTVYIVAVMLDTDLTCVPMIGTVRVDFSDMFDNFLAFADLGRLYKLLLGLVLNLREHCLKEGVGVWPHLPVTHIFDKLVRLR